MWGTKANPYVISNANHLQNLSTLQNRDYFYDATENYPYFVIANASDAQPIVIDGKGASINPIGNMLYPFCGTLYGARSTQASLDVVGKKSNTSVIQNFVISNQYGQPDVGLFGNVSFEGELNYTQTETEEGVFENVPDGTIKGFTATIKNLLMVDVQIKASNKTVMPTGEWLLQFFDSVSKVLTHAFVGSVEDYLDETKNSPCETHHFGKIGRAHV